MSKSPPTTALVRQSPTDGLIRSLGGLAVCEAPPQVFSDQQLMEMEPDRLRALVRDYQSRDVTQIRLTERGALRQVKIRMGLRVGFELTQFSQWDPNAGDDGAMVPCPPFINARGWYKANTVANIQLVLAKSVLVDGQERANPWYITNERTGSIERIYCRKIGIGRSATGNWIARDHTIVYLPHEYLLEDLHGKERRAKEAIRGYALPANATAPEGKFYFPEVFSPDGTQSMGMLIDPANGEVRKTLKTLAQRKKKALQIAQTQCDRDLLKKMLGLSDPPVMNGIGHITVTGWMEADADLQRIHQMVGEAGNGQLAGAMSQVGIVDVEVSTAEVGADDVDDEAERAEEDNEDTAAVVEDAAPEVNARPVPAAASPAPEPAAVVRDESAKVAGAPEKKNGPDPEKMAQYLASQRAASEALAAKQTPAGGGDAHPTPTPPPAEAQTAPAAPPKADANGQTGLPLPTATETMAARMAQAQADIAAIEKMAALLGDDFATACADAKVPVSTWRDAGPRGLAKLKATCTELLGGED